MAAVPVQAEGAVEEAAGAPYIFEAAPIEYTLTGCDGKSYMVTHRRHTDFPQHYDRAAEGLMGRGLGAGAVLEAECWLFDAAKLWDHALGMLSDDIFRFYKD